MKMSRLPPAASKSGPAYQTFSMKPSTALATAPLSRKRISRGFPARHSSRSLPVFVEWRYIRDLPPVFQVQPSPKRMRLDAPG
jgi:hypothetical protein